MFVRVIRVGMNIVLAHDSITQLGGAERVLEALHEIYPDAPVYTLVVKGMEICSVKATVPL
jgi:hypothetical protein